MSKQDLLTCFRILSYIWFQEIYAFIQVNNGFDGDKKSIIPKPKSFESSRIKFERKNWQLSSKKYWKIDCCKEVSRIWGFYHFCPILSIHKKFFEGWKIHLWELSRILSESLSRFSKKVYCNPSISPSFNHSSRKRC